MKNIDLFKIALIILLTWIGYSIQNYSKNGRYEYNESVPWMDDLSVFDTRTGRIYYYKSIDIDLINNLKKVSRGEWKPMYDDEE